MHPVYNQYSHQDFMLRQLLLIGSGILLIVACKASNVPTEGNTVQIYFGKASSSDCSQVFPVERFIPGTDALLEATLWELFQGPTASERENAYVSMFSEKSANLLISASQADGIVYVNMRDLRNELSSVSASCGSSAFMAAIERTVKQFPGVREVRYVIEGNPETFYEWVQLGCDPETNNCDPTPFGGA